MRLCAVETYPRCNSKRSASSGGESRGADREAYVNAKVENQGTGSTNAWGEVRGVCPRRPGRGRLRGSRTGRRMRVVLMFRLGRAGSRTSSRARCTHTTAVGSASAGGGAAAGAAGAAGRKPQTPGKDCLVDGGFGRVGWDGTGLSLAGPGDGEGRCDAQRRRWKGLHQHAARRARGAAGAFSRLTGSWHTLLEAPSASFEDKASLSRQPPRGPCTALLLSPPKGSWGCSRPRASPPPAHGRCHHFSTAPTESPPGLHPARCNFAVALPAVFLLFFFCWGGGDRAPGLPSSSSSSSPHLGGRATTTTASAANSAHRPPPTAHSASCSLQQGSPQPRTPPEQG